MRELTARLATTTPSICRIHARKCERVALTSSHRFHKIQSIFLFSAKGSRNLHIILFHPSNPLQRPEHPTLHLPHPYNMATQRQHIGCKVSRCGHRIYCTGTVSIPRRVSLCQTRPFISTSCDLPNSRVPVTRSQIATVSYSPPSLASHRSCIITQRALNSMWGSLSSKSEDWQCIPERDHTTVTTTSIRPKLPLTMS